MYDPNDFNTAAYHFGIRCDIFKGIIKAAFREAYVQQSCDKQVLLHAKPDVKVEVTQAFKEGAFALTPLSTSVVMTKESSV